MITHRQRDLRKKFLGSSDASAVVGLNPWQTSADVYYQKTESLEHGGIERDDPAITVGNFCEKATLDWFAKTHNVKLKRNVFRLHKNEIMCANLDAVIQGDSGQLVEAKTHGIISGYIHESWGEVETDQVPEHVAIQCQHQMAVVPEAEVVWVPVLLVKAGFQVYRVERDEELIANLTELEEAFWTKYVQAREPPPTEPSLEILRKLKRVPGKQVELNDRIVSEWLAAKEAYLSAQKVQKEAGLRVLKELGDAEGGTCHLGTVTYSEVKKRAYSVKATRYRKLGFTKTKEIT